MLSPGILQPMDAKSSPQLANEPTPHYAESIQSK